MRTLLSRAIHVDPSFQIGLSLIVILALAEIFAATSYYMGRTRASRVFAQSVAATVTRAPQVLLHQLWHSLRLRRRQPSPLLLSRL